MRTKQTALAAALVASVAVPALAAGAIFDVGPVAGETALPDPACPGKPCLAVSRTTGYQVKVGTVRGTHVIPEDGRIVAWSIKLSRPSKTQAAFFDKNLGGAASAQLTVLRTGKKLYARVLAQGNAVALEPYFGTTAQFALERSIAVHKGEVVALTVPTWAPALATGQAKTVSWRASRQKGDCNDFAKATAQTGTGNVSRFACLYTTARLSYSATIVPDPKTNGTKAPTGSTGATGTTGAG